MCLLSLSNTDKYTVEMDKVGFCSDAPKKWIILQYTMKLQKNKAGKDIEKPLSPILCPVAASPVFFSPMFV